MLGPLYVVPATIIMTIGSNRCAHPFLYDLGIKIHFTVIIIINGISSCKKKNLYNKTKSVLINKSKHEVSIRVSQLLGPEQP